jgi:PadR family transcriptional regulator PadR
MPSCWRILLSVTEVSAVSKPTDLVQGTLDLLILKIVALEPLHGWAIAQRIRQMSSEVLQVGQSALYPALHKLEQQGWIEAEWKVSETNRRAKYYSLTRAGRKALAQEAANWERLSGAISAIVHTI